MLGEDSVHEGFEDGFGVVDHNADHLVRVFLIVENNQVLGDGFPLPKGLAAVYVQRTRSCPILRGCRRERSGFAVV